MFKRVLPIILVGAAMGASAHAAGAFTPADYTRALWMTTRFYGSQRVGQGPNWMLMKTQYPKAYAKDSKDGRDLSGGWGDCGDFPTFGQTFFYSAHILAKAYATFPTGYPDLYHGFDYSDYAQTDNFDQSGGKPDGIPDLLQELKYATDWIIKATPDSSTFYYQKGTGAAGDYGQHAFWLTSGAYSALKKAIEGGESDASRPIWSVTGDANMPSHAAATLAIMARVYRKYDPSYAAQCLKHARQAFGFARVNPGMKGTALGGFYGPNKSWQDAYVSAAAELYMTTGEEVFKNLALATTVADINAGWGFDYENEEDLAHFDLGSILGQANRMNSFKTNSVDKSTSPLSSEGITWKPQDGNDHFKNRYVGNAAFLAALYGKHNGVSSYDDFIYKQVDYLMGANNAKQSMIVGFCAGCSREPQQPHHRNSYGNENPAVTDKVPAFLPIPTRNKQVGGVVPGTLTSGGFAAVDIRSNYNKTELCIDINAGTVGALGYIMSKVAPVDTSKLGTVSIAPRPHFAEAGKFMVSKVADGLLFAAPTGADLQSLEVVSLDGRVLWAASAPGREVKWNPAGAAQGVMIVRARTAAGAEMATTFVR